MEKAGWPSSKNAKIEKDEVKLRELQDNLAKSQQLTGGMVTILDSFTSRLKKLDDTILPMYNETLNLTRLQENVDKSLEWMEEVIGYYHVVEEVEVKIREGPGGDIEHYLTLLDQLKQAMDHFNQFNSESLELVHLNELFYCGMEALVREFRQHLQKHSKPVHIATLHDIAMCEEVEDMPAITLLPVQVVKDLRVIADYLVKSPGINHTDIMSLYAQIRCSQLGRAMNTLLQTSQNQSLLPPTVPKKSAFTATFLKASHTPTRKGNPRKGGGVGPPPLSSEPSALSLSDDSLEGCASFMMATTVFLRLIQSEVRLMEEVIPSAHRAHVLDSFIKQPMDFFLSRGETIFQQARKTVAHHDYSVVISCLQLLRHVKSLLPEYRVVLQGLESKPHDRFVHLLQQFDRLCSKALQEDYIQNIKVDSEKQSNLPKDGTVHSLTSNTMRFVQALLEYAAALGDIFQGLNSFSLGGSTSDLEKKKAVGQYLVRVVDALNFNMEHKAKNFESPYLAAIFLLNNFHFVHKTFSQNDQMLNLLEEAFADIENHYSGLVMQQGRAYHRGFQKLINYLGQEALGLSQYSSGDKMSNQKRQVLKDKFKGFNTELEELHKIQKDWSLPDHVLRSRVRNDNVELIVPLYTIFHERYGSRNFTKNPEKYLKYTPDTLNNLLLTFFDGGAT